MKACSSLWAGFVQPCNSALPTDPNLRGMGTPGSVNHFSWSWLIRLWGRDFSFPQHLLMGLTSFLNEYFSYYFPVETIDLLESRLKGPTYVTDNSKPRRSSKSHQPCPCRTPLSAAWPSWLTHAAEQALSLVPCVPSKYTAGTACGVFLF